MNEASASAVRLLPLSPSQTIGPFFHDVVILTGSRDTAIGSDAGESILIEGRVLDGDGDPVDDALVEIWQPEGDVEKNGTSGFARSETRDAGHFRFTATKPNQNPAGPVPFVAVRLFARGLLRSLVTRIYFEDHPNADDPVMQSVDPPRRATLIAKRDESTRPPTYRFDIHLQGDRETVFFELRDRPS